MRPKRASAAATACGDLVRLGDVEAEHERPRLMTGGEIGDLRRIARGDDGAVAALQRMLRERPPEAGRAAGDEPYGFVLARHGASPLSVGREV